MSSTTEAGAVPRAGAARIALGVLAAAAGAAVVNVLIAVLAVAAGASDGFNPLQPAAYVPLTVFGVLAGTAGWAAVRRWARRPAAVLRRLVPVVVAVSLVPDLALLGTDMQPHTTGLGVAALMLMHVATAAVTVPILARVLPPSTAR
jgi:hypothetical protein